MYFVDGKENRPEPQANDANNESNADVVMCFSCHLSDVTDIFDVNC
jgi:hypothetical protein